MEKRRSKQIPATTLVDSYSDDSSVLFQKLKALDRPSHRSPYGDVLNEIVRIASDGSIYALALQQSKNISDPATRKAMQGLLPAFMDVGFFSGSYRLVQIPDFTYRVSDIFTVTFPRVLVNETADRGVYLFSLQGGEFRPYQKCLLKSFFYNGVLQGHPGLFGVRKYVVFAPIVDAVDRRRVIIEEVSADTILAESEFAKAKSRLEDGWNKCQNLPAPPTRLSRDDDLFRL